MEVVAARPTETDKTMIAQLAVEAEATDARDGPHCQNPSGQGIPPPTAHGWALYAGDTRIPKYWEYPGGIYFKVLDEDFLAEHQGEKLRFSENGKDFIDTGVKLPGPVAGRDDVQASAPSASAVGSLERDRPHALGPQGCTSERAETAPRQEALDIGAGRSRATGQLREN